MFQSLILIGNDRIIMQVIKIPPRITRNDYVVYGWRAVDRTNIGKGATLNELEILGTVKLLSQFSLEFSKIQS